MSVQTQIERIRGEVTTQSSLIKQIASGLRLDPFALTASNWSVWGNASAMTINEDSISLVKGSGNSNYMTCLHRFTRKEGTYSFSVKGNDVVQNNAVATIVQIFGADGNEITEKGHYVPNHGYAYNSAYGGFAMNTSYGSFTFTLTEDVSYFVMKFAPGGMTSEGGTVVISEFSLTEPGVTSTEGTPIEKNTSKLEEISGAVADGKYIIPVGELEIAENGTHDVKNYESVNVNVESSGGGASVETCTVTINCDYLMEVYYTTVVDGEVHGGYYKGDNYGDNTCTVEALCNSIIFVPCYPYSVEVSDGTVLRTDLLVGNESYETYAIVYRTPSTPNVHATVDIITE